MQKPQDFDQVTVGGEFRPLPAGGYVCKILKAEERLSSKGNPMLVIALDISEGIYAGYFLDLFKKRKESASDPFSVKFPCIHYQNTQKADGSTSKMFKSLITAIEKSGTEVIWGDHLADSLVNGYVGVLFGREEWEGSDGKRHWSTKPFYFRSVDAIESGDFEIPEDRPMAEPEGTGSFGTPYASTADDFPF